MRSQSPKSALHASFNIIRVGKHYKLTNHGDTAIFEVIEVINDNDCLAKTLDTLETFHLHDLIKYGKGADFDFEEI